MSRKPVIAVASLLVAMAVSAFAYQCDVTSVFVSPQVDGAIENRLIAEIGAAQTSLRIALLSFTDDQLGTAVVQAKRRGVAVSVLVSSGAANDSGSEVCALKSEGIDVRYATTGGTFHHKFAIIDSNTVVTGSYNWTEAANESNYENIVVIRCPEIAQRFIDQWNYLLATYSFASEPCIGHQLVCTTPFIGNKNSKVCHKATCKTLPAPENQVCFATIADAQAANYKPCGNCNPW